jgi:hypothetical protein
LVAMGIENVVVDSASIEVNRRAGPTPFQWTGEYCG